MVDNAGVDPSAHTPQRGRLLLAASEPEFAAAGREILERAGHRVLVTRDGLGALAALAADRHDVVVADLGAQNGAGGAALCREIRADRGLDGVHVILLGRGEGGQGVAEGLAAGADDCLNHPFHPAELLARVASGLRVVQLQRELASANRALRELSMSDPLTGLPNRRAVEQALTVESARVNRRGGSACVVCVDLDGFRSVNQRYGHAVGDLVLVAFAGAVRAALRTQDQIGRVGGDEFLVVLPDTALAGAVELCRRLREAVAAVRVPGGRGELAVTASFGVAPVFPGDDPQVALDVADGALYAAKTGGRNRVESATETVP